MLFIYYTPVTFTEGIVGGYLVITLLYCWAGSNLLVVTNLLPVTREFKGGSKVLLPTWLIGIGCTVRVGLTAATDGSACLFIMGLATGRESLEFSL